jgi:hypothetical protein
MNLSLRTLRSPIALGMIWIFVAAYFFDAANLDDLVPGSVVLHPDTNESSLVPSTVLFAGFSGTPSRPAPLPATPVQCNNTHAIRLIIDQDSPSLAAEQLVAISCSTILSEEQCLPVQSYRSASSLYLLNCTLLI